MKWQLLSTIWPNVWKSTSKVHWRPCYPEKVIEAIVNSIHEPIIGLDHDRQILFVNNEALTVLNLKREQMIHQSADELSLKNDLLRRLIRELVHPNEKHEPLKIYADDKESFSSRLRAD